jgi:hypothetical protein
MSNHKLAAFMYGPGAAFVLAVVIFVAALLGHVGPGLALLMAGVMAAYGVILIAGRRWDFVGVLAAPGRDERASNLHLRAAAAGGQVMAAVILGGFFWDVLHGNVDHSQWPWLAALFGVTYLLALVVFVRRG